MWKECSQNSQHLGILKTESVMGRIGEGEVNRVSGRVQVKVVFNASPLKLEFYPVAKSLKTFKKVFHYFKYLIADSITVHMCI